MTDEERPPISAENSEDTDSPSTESESESYSLDALSEAYARALAQQNQDRDETAGEANALETDSRDPIEPGEDESTDSFDDESEETESLDDISDDAPCPISPKSILEAMLFVGTPDGSSMTNRSLASRMRGVSPKEVTQLTHELNQEYETADACYRIKREGGGYRMELREKWEPVRQKFYGEVKQARLSQSVIDVLSIVAYRQPVTREQVDKIRARPCGSLLLQLVRRGLLVREKTEAKPVQTLFRTTDRFLELFGLECIEDLPQTETSEFND